MSRFLVGAVCGVLAAYLWFTWAPSSYEARVERLERYVASNPIGAYGPDTWLIDSALGQSFPTALIFGYADNDQICTDIVRALNVRTAPQLTCISNPPR